jgi:demethylmenaquinone methyltransferase/2-methoxy-6-polyprenyl-1,4-benzoquinol methylase
MLTLASKRSGERSLWSEADALQLPFHPESFSITSCAFGVRNFHELDIGLREMHRVLLPGGRAVIIEFTRPSNRVARALYELYSTRFMPMAATLISGDKSGAYRYLPSSVVTFLNAEQMCERLRRAGFAQVVATPMTLGIVTVYVATKD